MKIYSKQSVVQKCAKTSAEDVDVKALIMQYLNEQKVDDDAELAWEDNETAMLKSKSGMTLHGLVLLAEKQGINVTIEKQTVVRFQ
ncbi:MAG: hypothetical protein MRY83_23755 [Flavobacteriales bacterium]|nr:hypothetical protein [Flavobacteriales bacterium]